MNNYIQCLTGKKEKKYFQHDNLEDDFELLLLDQRNTQKCILFHFAICRLMFL